MVESRLSGPLVRELLEDYSLEITGKDGASLGDAHRWIPIGTRVNITYLGNENIEMRMAAVTATQQAGCLPVAHVAARRLESETDLTRYLDALGSVDARSHLFLVAGDPSEPAGPFPDSLSVIETGILERSGVRHLGLAGYPDGHPDIDDAVLWDSLEKKSAALTEHGMSGTIITQFGFDAEQVLAWVEQVRLRGIELPIRIGVPGPAGIRRLLKYAARFGVASSAGIAKKYGFSLTNLLGTTGPDQFLYDVADSYRPEVHGCIRLHFYTFGGLAATAKWLDDFTEGTRR